MAGIVGLELLVDEVLEALYNRTDFTFTGPKYDCDQIRRTPRLRTEFNYIERRNTGSEDAAFLNRIFTR